jgi:RNA-directed DNA polymerase
MTVLRSTGAPPLTDTMWNLLDWDHAVEVVTRLQTRIAKATQESRWNKVQALQHLLTRSASGKLLAVKRVTENAGKKTAGVDGKVWATPMSKLKAAQSLVHRGYQPLPLRRVYIPKSNGKMRPLGIPTMHDRAMQALWSMALAPVAETTADPNSYGFRQGRSTADAIEQCFCALAKRSSAQWVLEGDIRGCFDNISHDWLMQNIPMDVSVLRKWLRAGYVDKGNLFPTTAGTPQGGIISPVLANMVLDGLEATVHRAIGPTRNARQPAKVHVVRYADDFVVTCASKDMLEKRVMPAVEKFLGERGLQLAPEKTRVTHIAMGFDFLGQNVRKYKAKLLIKPARKSVTSLLTKVRGVLRKNKAATQSQVVMELNPIIRGWAMYHRHVVAKSTFRHIDHDVWELLWQWAKRRHPKKNLHWVKARYFHQHGIRDWIFAADPKEAGLAYPPVLFRAMTIPIKRHTKIRGDANPFDPGWADYFERRKYTY